MGKTESITLKSPENIRQVLEESAEEAYNEVTNLYGEYFGSDPKEIFYQNTCQQFSEIMRAILKRKGIDSNYEKVDIKNLVPGGKHHIFLSTKNYLIDGTWQQFLNKIRKNHHFLILNKNSLESDLEKASVPRELWFMYGVKSITKTQAA